MKTEKTFLVDYTMADQYHVTVGSVWNYNKAFDNSPLTHGLVVKTVSDNGVEFEQKMPFTRYPLYAFNGYIFKPEKP